MYSALRRMGRDRNTAAELTQGFFVDVVLQRRLFERANVNRGKLRTLLLTALGNYVVDTHRRRAIDPSRNPISLSAMEAEESRIAAEGYGREPASEHFDRRWALGILEEAMTRCERRFHARGKERHWRAFEAWILLPAVGQSAPSDLRQVARLTGFSGSAQVAAAIQTVRVRLAAHLAEVVSETVESAADVAEEIEYVQRILNRKSP
ncbi:MAG: hypothetical protein AB7Q91_10685 [Phycisphaerales bacterium]